MLQSGSHLCNRPSTQRHSRLRSSSVPFRRLRVPPITSSRSSSSPTATAAAAERPQPARGAFEGWGSTLTAEQRSANAFCRTDMSTFVPFEKAIHYTFSNARLGLLCTFHPSSMLGGTQRVLSRLGIDVWAAICTVHLAAVYPKAEASAVATLAQAMATGEAIQAVVEQLKVEDFLNFQRSPSLSRPNEKMMKSFLFAILAAVFLDSGLDGAYATFSPSMEFIRKRMPEHLTQRCLQDATLDPSAKAPEEPPEEAAPSKPPLMQRLFGFSSLFNMPSSSSKLEPSPAAAAAKPPLPTKPVAKAADPGSPGKRGTAAGAGAVAVSQAQQRVRFEESRFLDEDEGEGEGEEEDYETEEVRRRAMLYLSGGAPKAEPSPEAVQRASLESAATKGWAQLLPIRDVLAGNVLHNVLPGGKKPRGVKVQALASALGGVVEAVCSPSPAAGLRQAAGLRALVGRALWTLALASQGLAVSPEPKGHYVDPKKDERFPKKARADRAWQLLGLGDLAAAAAGPLLGEVAGPAEEAGEQLPPAELSGRPEEQLPMVTVSRLAQVFDAALGAICLDSRDKKFEFELAGQACSWLMSIPSAAQQEQ